MTSVTPVCLSRNSLSHSRCRACGSRPVVGSSSSSRSGRLMRERAIVSRRFMPPERSSTLDFAFSVSWTNSSSSCGALADLGGRDPEVPAVDEQVVEDVELVVEGVLLRADPEPAADGRAVRRRVEAEDAQVAVGHRRDGRDHPHRRGLAGAVGAEEAERLAPAYGDVDAAHRLEVAERLAQVPRLDHQVLGRAARSGTPATLGQPPTSPAGDIALGLSAASGRITA